MGGARGRRGPRPRPRRGRGAGARALALAGGALALARDPAASRAELAPGGACPATSSAVTWSGALLGTDTTRSGVIYKEGSGGKILLARAGSAFKSAAIATPGTIVFTAAADFNRDGWPDFAGAPDTSGADYLTVFRNDTWQNEGCTSAACTSYTAAGPPAWEDPNTVIAPKVTAATNLHGAYAAGAPAVTRSGRYSLAAADFSGDGWPDLLEGYAAAPAYGVTALSFYLNAAANDAGGDATFLPRYAAESGFSPGAALGAQLWATSSAQAVDVNRDGRVDVLIGSGARGGSIRVLYNNCPGTAQGSGVVLCSAPPQLTDGGDLIAHLDTVGGAAEGFGAAAPGGTPAFAYADVDGDGLRDLIVGAPDCCATASRRLRLFKGCAGGTGCTAGLEDTASQSLAFPGAAVGVFVADYSLDGRPDLVVTTDDGAYNAGAGGAAYYFVNNGSATPFSAAPAQLTAHGVPLADHDLGLVLDYDRDPQETPDLLVADAGDPSTYTMLANRIGAQYVACGDVWSAPAPLGALAQTEMVVTAARMTPAIALGGGSATYWLSNEEPAAWVQASPCAGSATDYCAAFARTSGRSVRWKITLCSNAAHSKTPTLTGVDLRFDYTQASEHYRAGTVVGDGTAYIGAFHEPGDRGRLYAMNADLVTPCGGGPTPVCWEGGARLDATPDGSRQIYTAQAGSPARLPFSAAGAADPALRSLLGTADAASTASLVAWVRSARFGLGNPTLPLTRLGAVETSTPALLGRPGRPSWYSFATALDRARIDAFVAAQAGRKGLVLFGAKDGMIHALHTRPADLADPRNGQEAWAYIPPTVASGLLRDFTATAAANAAAGDGQNHPVITAYPDGSPTLVDYHAGGGVYRTVALVAEGNGGRSLSALDVTQTVDPATDEVTGPEPLWSATPGDGEAGQAYAKPAVARVLLGGRERYVAVAATGVDYTDPADTKGRVVAGYDLPTGRLLWRFQARCPVTSDLTVLETDDALEPGAPALDGFADRVIFADKCGYVYKLAPGADLGGGWYDNAGMGALAAGTAPDGTAQYALFSTRLTAGALGQDRPIAGTIAARTDSSTRMVLFFGTGGLAPAPATAPNAFYAVYADTGQIRSAIAGACDGSGACEKFYGGTVVTAEQVIFTRTIDPAVGTGACDAGSTLIQAVQLSAAGGGNNFVTDFTLAVSSAVMGSLYGDAGALYLATLSGDVARIGAPRARVAGDDTRSGAEQGMGAGDLPSGGEALGTPSPLSLMGWRVVL